MQRSTRPPAVVQSYRPETGAGWTGRRACMERVKTERGGRDERTLRVRSAPSAEVPGASQEAGGIPGVSSTPRGARAVPVETRGGQRELGEAGRECAATPVHAVVGGAHGVQAGGAGGHPERQGVCVRRAAVARSQQPHDEADVLLEPCSPSHTAPRPSVPADKGHPRVRQGAPRFLRRGGAGGENGGVGGSGKVRAGREVRRSR
mmetsp:Transcript_38103/g.73065  ORF Transcript_38103/g.73065 Transcript_38103/m.73065 type:complete len:205 (-) Transcript_38103:406-1020(-)